MFIINPFELWCFLFIHSHIKELQKWKRFSSLQPYQWEVMLVSHRETNLVLLTLVKD